MRLMRSTFFERGLRGRRPGALLRRLHRPFYEGQLAGYLRYLHEKEVEAALKAPQDLAVRIVIDYPVATTRGDRIVAGTIAAGCLICASYVAGHLTFLASAPELDRGIHTVILYVILGVIVGFFVLLGYTCLRVVFEK